MSGRDKDGKKIDPIFVTKLNPRKAARESIVKRFKSNRTAAGITLDTPLGELREALEDEKEADKFLGDPMFWQYPMSIEQKRICRPTTVEYRNLKLMCCETLFYFFLVIFFTIFIFTLQSPTVYESRAQQRAYWLGCDSAACDIDDVKDMKSFWYWMENDLISKAFPDVEPLDTPVANITTSYGQSNGYSITYHPRMVGETNTNILLGSMRIRQLRVQKGLGCIVAKQFRHVFPACYAAFGPSVQSKETFSTRYTPTYLGSFFEWNAAGLDDETPTGLEKTPSYGAPLDGDLATYPGDGYFLDLPADKEESRILLQDLHEWNWVDQATRAVVIEMTVLNSNTNVILNNRLLFEFGATGTVQPSEVINAFRVFFVTLATNAGAELTVFLFQVIIFFFFFALTCYLVWQIYRVGGKFFQYGWNLLDVLLVFMWYYYFILRCTVLSNVGGEPTLKTMVVGHPEYFMPFSQNFAYLLTANRVLAFLALFVYVKILKYLPIVSWFRMLLKVCEDCVGRLFRFALLIIVLFTGYGIAFFVGLGQTDKKYFTVERSFTGLFFMLIEGITIDENWFEPQGSAVGPFLSLSYLILVYFILANIFMAIVLEAYVAANVCIEVRAKEDDLSLQNPMFLFLDTYMHVIRGLSVVSLEEGLPDEHAISLYKLPNIVTRKWLEKKRRMQLLVDQTLGEFTEAEVKRKNSKMNARPESSKSRKRKRKGCMEICGRLKLCFLRALGCPEASEFLVPEPDDDAFQIKMYQNPQFEDDDAEISRSQLQRLLDQEPMLRILLGTGQALDVIRTFKAGDAGLDDDSDASSGADGAALEKVRKLQESVFIKIDKLERQGLGMDRNKVPLVDDLANELADCIQGVQNEWREEISNSMAVVTSVAEEFGNLADGIADLQDNQERLRQMLNDGSDYSDSTYSSSLSSDTSSSGSVEIKKESKGMFGFGTLNKSSKQG